MNRVSLRGVVLGALVDFAMTNILAVPLVLYAILHFQLQHLPPADAQMAVASAIHGSVALTLIEIAIGLGSAAAGGYVAARLARHDETLNGALASWLCVGISLYTLFSGQASHTPKLQWLLIVAIPLCALLGGALCRRQRAHS